MPVEYYNEEQLNEIVQRTAAILNTKIEATASEELARRSRGTPDRQPSVAPCKGLCPGEGDGNITTSLSREALELLQVDKLGLDHIDHKLLKGIIERFRVALLDSTRLLQASVKNPIRLKMCMNRIYCRSGSSNGRREEGSSPITYMTISRWRCRTSDRTA